MNRSPLATPPEPDPIAHLHLMRLLEEHPEYTQRQLSEALGMSLGKAHYLLKALLGRGLVKAQSFQRSEHKWGYLYVLTPAGARRKVQLTRAFLVRKERQYEQLRHEIEALRSELTNHTG